MNREIKPYIVPELLGPSLDKLTKFLGSPVYKVDSGLQQVRAWGKMGSTELRITYDKLLGNWTLQFMIFTPDQSYRKVINRTTFDLAHSWLELNAEFIMENMNRG